MSISRSFEVLGAVGVNKQLIFKNGVNVKISVVYVVSIK